MARSLQRIRNIGIIAHIDAGKTTVTERMLFLSGAKHRVGRVDHGTTETDSDAEEQERGITIYSACVTFDWKKWNLNLLDTPGHVDFTAEVERCLRVLDGAVVVFSAREGVEAQSETVWKQANQYQVPRIAFINKLDREGADFERVLGQMTDRLGACAAPICIPVGQGPPHVADPFRGVIDLLRMEFLTFDRESHGREFTAESIPDEFRAEAEIWRERLIEQLSMLSDELMELALAEEVIPEALLKKVLRQATLGMQLQPVLCGSALHGIAVQQLLDAVGEYLPSPNEIAAIEGVDPSAGDKTVVRRPEEDEPFCGLVFKILPAKTGDWYWVRVYSGSLKANSRVLNPEKNKKENVAQLWQIHATRKERQGQIDKVGTGDIVGIIGPRYSITGDTLCDPQHQIQLPGIQFAETVVSMAIEPESSTERDKLADTLAMLTRQDPTFDSEENEETGQTLIRGMGELHLEVIKHRLLREFKLNVKVHPPRVSYRETVAQEADATGVCQRQISGQSLFAEVDIRIEPFAKGQMPVTVISRCPPESLIPEYLQATLEELRASGEGGGPIGSFPLTRIKVTIVDCRFNEQSSDVAFRIAASDAFEKALRNAQPVLLEPIMRLELATPEEHLGDLVNDLQQRRSIITRTENRGNDAVVEAHAPLRELFGYSNAMRSLSQGRATCSMEPLQYDPAPDDVVKQYQI